MSWWLKAPKVPKGSGQWCVWKVSPEEKKTIRHGLTNDQARDLASWFRDNCPDSEVVAGVNYLAGSTSGPQKVHT